MLTEMERVQKHFSEKVKSSKKGIKNLNLKSAVTY